MIILGMHLGHDSGICVIKDGKLVAAINAERLNRKKKWHGMTQEMFDYICKAANITLEEIDCVAIGEWYKDGNDLITADFYAGVGGTHLYENEVSKYTATIRGRQIPAYSISHHLAHCAAAYYTSPYEAAWCISMDSSHHAIENNSMVAYGSGNKLEFKYCPRLISGIGYYHFTDMLGLGNPSHKAGSTMGLASYGKPLPKVIDTLPYLVDRCFYPHDDKSAYIAYWRGLFTELGGGSGFSGRDSYMPLAQNLAASIQLIFEESLKKTANDIDTGGITNLCLGGGSLFNCTANTVLRTQTQFTNVHLFPACGDEGLCVGVALYVAHHILDEPRAKYEPQELAYLGQTRELECEPDYQQIADIIAHGGIVAWYQGASEFGPRALGNRSLLADPRDFHNREKLNFVIKNREWFRPFAPSVLAEKSHHWFDFPDASPYMLHTSQVLWPQLVPAITHVDGSARQQTVTPSSNRTYYNLIKAFEAKTSVPMLVNTSLNGRDEPILETPEDALRFWNSTPVDALVLNGKLMTR